MRSILHHAYFHQRVPCFSGAKKCQWLCPSMSRLHKAEVYEVQYVRGSSSSIHDNGKERISWAWSTDAWNDWSWICTLSEKTLQRYMKMQEKGEVIVNDRWGGKGRKQYLPDCYQHICGWDGAWRSTREKITLKMLWWNGKRNPLRSLAAYLFHSRTCSLILPSITIHMKLPIMLLCVFASDLNC